jgi:organic radical activating enzyme
MSIDPKTFCIAPFKHACIESKGNLRVCCVSKEKNEYRYDQIEEWYKSDTLKKLRKNLKDGIKDPICTGCWKAEENGKISQRNIYNKHIGKILSNHFIKSFEKNNELKKIMQNDDDYNNIDSFDMQLGNHCNLKCIMCGPHYSSEILLETKKYKEIDIFYKRENSKNFVWAKEKNFIDWCTKNLKKTRHIKFTGGEPFLNPYLLDTLKNIPLDQKKKCILHFATNLTIINEEILKILDYFKETWLTVSVEGIGKVLEYARFGHKWEDLENNLHRIENIKNKNIFLNISHVVQAPTFYGIDNLISYFDNKHLKLNALFLENPKVFKLTSIKTEYKEKFLEKFKNYNGYNIEYVNSLLSFIKNNLMYDPLMGEKCVERLQIFDKIRKNSFQDIIPIDYFI